MSVDVLVIGKAGDKTAKLIPGIIDEATLYKKAGFKSANGFIKQTEWQMKLKGVKYFVVLYGKTDGRANMENKYDFPPPVDTTLFFGSCILVAYTGAMCPTSLSCELWDIMYEKLFGGFEDLDATAQEDENEIDELSLIPANKKTKNGGYLKDGFVIDSDTDSEKDDIDESEEQPTEEEEEEEDNVTEEEATEDSENIGSELSEESYCTESDEEESS